MNNVQGLVEIKGLVGVIEVVDVMVKFVNVQLVGYEKIGFGLVIVMVCGDVGVVKVVVDVGSVVVSVVGEVKFCYVILCLYSDVEVILLKLV